MQHWRGGGGLSPPSKTRTGPAVRSDSLVEQRRFEINIVRAEYSGCGRHRSAAAAGPQGTSYRHFKRKPCTTMVQYLIGFQRWHWAGEAQTFAEQQRPRS